MFLVCMRSDKHTCSQWPAIGLHVFLASTVPAASHLCIPVAIPSQSSQWFRGIFCPLHGRGTSMPMSAWLSNAVQTRGHLDTRVRWQQRLGRLGPFTYVRHAKRFDVQLEFHSAQLLHATLHVGLLHVILPRYFLDDAAANS